MLFGCSVKVQVKTTRDQYGGTIAALYVNDNYIYDIAHTSVNNSYGQARAYGPQEFYPDN